jgi:PAS domain S-box-containing protein
MSILVVDDESESRTLLTEILAAEGFDARAADGGELALASLPLNQPELILLDIRMPGIDGFEVCRRLKAREDTRDIPVIILSASGESADRVEGLRLGAVDFVTKPFQREELLARVRTHLELRRLRLRLEHRVAERTAELRESEERFRTMADAAPVMIWISGADGRGAFFNHGWLEFTGRTIDQESGVGWVDGIHPDDRERWSATCASSFDARRSFDSEFRLRRADGEYRWVLNRGVPRFSPDGLFAGYIGSCIDITDLKQHHDRLLASQKLESLGVMAAGVAHDFGNLLGAIYGETDLALSDLAPGAPGRENVEKIAELANRATEIVRMLMTSAGGRGRDEFGLVDLSSEVEQMLRLLKVSISKRAEVRSSLPKGLPAVRGNVAQIHQVVINLITNASDALGGQPGMISVSTDITHLAPGFEHALPNLPEGDYVRLQVADTGCGISPETRSKIFDQFFTTKSVGRGLGLAAVHGIVRSHGGAISVDSAPGKGATFQVLFPPARPMTRSAGI